MRYTYKYSMTARAGGKSLFSLQIIRLSGMCKVGTGKIERKATKLLPSLKLAELVTIQ